MAETGISRTVFNLSLPVIPILIPALVHLALVTLALLLIQPYAWPPSYLFIHLVVILCAFWASLDKKGWEPVVSFIVAVVVSIITDMIMLGVYFHNVTTLDNDNLHPLSLRRFSAAMIIINLLMKPVTLVMGVVAIFFRRDTMNCNFFNRAKDSYDALHGSVDVEGQQQ